MAADWGKDGFEGNCSIIGTRVRELRMDGKANWAVTAMLKCRSEDGTDGGN